MQMKPHKWAKEIKAWADGAEIEWRFNSVATGGCGFWENVLSENPVWHDPRVDYRIKPQPKEPQYLHVYEMGYLKYFFSHKQVDSEYKYIGKIKLEQDDE